MFNERLKKELLNELILIQTTNESGGQHGLRSWLANPLTGVMQINCKYILCQTIIF